ncbi:MAG: DMT family transporter, partial [Candidatus Heimdallarchaeota archaeon]|nr:DMT family transporter [Candidatus Heimdallarchaeota archaeon]
PLFAIGAVFATILFGISSILTKFLIRDFGNSFNFLVYQLLVSFPLVALLAYVEITRFDGLDGFLSVRTIMIMLVLSFFTFFGYMFLLFGWEKGDISVGGIILSTRVLIATPLAYFLLQERYPTIIYFFVVIGFVGAITVSWQSEMSLKSLFTFKASGIGWFFLTSLFWAIGNFFVTYLGNDVPPFFFLFVRQGFMILFLVAFYLVNKSRFDHHLIKRSDNFFSLSISYFVALLSAQVLFIYALGNSLTITEGIGVSEGIFTVIMSVGAAYFIGNQTLQEPLDRKTLTVRLIGSVITLICTLGIIFSVVN